MTAILGISAFDRDSAAALVVDGRIVAAAQEERFSRRTHDNRVPVNAIEYCLQAGNLKHGQLDWVGFCSKPLLKFERLLETYVASAPRGFHSFAKSMPRWITNQLSLPREADKALNHAVERSYIFTEHHESQAASAFFPSPFAEAAILTLDEGGEWVAASWGVGRSNRIDLRHEQHLPHSLGLLYSALNHSTGFMLNGGEDERTGPAAGRDTSMSSWKN